MRSQFLVVMFAAGAAACGASSNSSGSSEAQPDPAKAPATEPAVISVPLNLPTLSVDSQKASGTSVIPADSLQRVFIISGGYGLVTAMMINQDERMLSNLYLPTAVLRVPDTTITGNTGIVRKLASLAQSRSLSDFQRTSQGMRIVDDSTLADSGVYVMYSKRSPKNVALERGRYATTWRARKDPTKWVIIEDIIRPAGTPGAKPGK